MANFKDLWGTARAAEYLGVGQSTVWRWAKAGKITAYYNKVNRWYYFKEEDLAQFMENVMSQSD